MFWYGWGGSRASCRLDTPSAPPGAERGFPCSSASRVLLPAHPICPWSLEPHEEKIILTEWHTRAQDLYPQGDPRHTCSQTLCVPRGGRARRAGRTLRPRAPTIKPLDSSFGSCWVFVRHRSVAFGLSCFLVQVNMDHGLSSSLVHLGIKEHNQAMTRNTSFQIHIYVSSDTWKYV